METLPYSHCTEGKPAVVLSCCPLTGQTPTQPVSSHAAPWLELFVRWRHPSDSHHLVGIIMNGFYVFSILITPMCALKILISLFAKKYPSMPSHSTLNKTYLHTLMALTMCVFYMMYGEFLSGMHSEVVVLWLWFIVEYGDLGALSMKEGLFFHQVTKPSKLLWGYIFEWFEVRFILDSEKTGL